MVRIDPCHGSDPGSIPGSFVFSFSLRVFFFVATRLCSRFPTLYVALRSGSGHTRIGHVGLLGLLPPSLYSSSAGNDLLLMRSLQQLLSFLTSFTWSAHHIFTY